MIGGIVGASIFLGLFVVGICFWLSYHLGWRAGAEHVIDQLRTAFPPRDEVCMPFAPGREVPWPAPPNIEDEYSEEDDVPF